MGESEQVIVSIENAIAAVNAHDWDAAANPDPARRNPFLSHAFLEALEQSGCVSEKTGWYPQHLVLTDDTGAVRGVMPCYLKSHSRGEYVFDHGWADAYERAGGQYYPKLLSAVPFTPATGRRFLVPDSPDAAARKQMLLSAAVQLTEKHGVSSFHANFVTEGEWELGGRMGLLQRTDQQFHWQNNQYGTFEDFLEGLASRKRKAIKKERRQALENGVKIEWITGTDLTEAHWDTFFEFYLDTGARKWGAPYLTRDFFSLLGERMANDVLLILCRHGGAYIAGALNIIGGDTLFGRYWGCTEYHPGLHFEVCYYQAIDFAIERGLAHVEAGAQGEHKLARGYLPKTTYSLHHIPDPAFRRAVANYLAGEREYVAETNEILCRHTPFRKDGG